MSDRERLLPPRKKNWKKGIPQIGVFLRTEDGGTIEMVHDTASPEQVAFVVCLLRGMKHVDPKIVKAVYEYVRDTTPAKNPKNKNGVGP